MSSCATCGTTGPLDQHHTVRRSQGGTETIGVCRRCHARFTENKWRWVELEDGYMVTDWESGEVLMRRVVAPDFDQSKFITNLREFSGQQLIDTQSVELLEHIRNQLSLVDEEGLRHVFEDGRQILQFGYLLQAWTVASFKERYVTRSNATTMAILAKHFGCSPRTIYNRLVLARLPLHHVATLPSFPIRALVEAGKWENPEAALSIVVDQTNSGRGSVAIAQELRAMRLNEEPPEYVPCPMCSTKFKKGWEPWVDKTESS